MDTISTRFLVLRKTPYSETSLILAGISPDQGQIHFMVKGARRLGRTQFPAVDTLRTLNVEYRPGRGELYSWLNADMAEDFSAVARQPAAYPTAVWLSHFALSNIPHALPQDRFFLAIETALRRLGALAEPGTAPELITANCLAARVGLAVVYLDEHGLLPDYRGDARLIRQRQALLDMAENRTPIPTLPPAAWQALLAWALRMLQHADCRLPQDTSGG